MRAGSFWCDDLMYRQSTPLPGRDWRRSTRPLSGCDDDERSDESCDHDMDAEEGDNGGGDGAAASVTEGAATFILVEMLLLNRRVGKQDRPGKDGGRR